MRGPACITHTGPNTGLTPDPRDPFSAPHGACRRQSWRTLTCTPQSTKKSLPRFCRYVKGSQSTGAAEQCSTHGADEQCDRMRPPPLTRRPPPLTCASAAARKEASAAARASASTRKEASAAARAVATASAAIAHATVGAAEDRLEEGEAEPVGPASAPSESFLGPRRLREAIRVLSLRGEGARVSST